MTSKNVHVASHPVVAQKMTYLRDVKTSSQDFRRLLREVTFYLGYEVNITFFAYSWKFRQQNPLQLCLRPSRRP